MLRISKSNQSQHVTLKIEGKLLAPWVDVVRHQCQIARQEHENVRLDLSSVSFVDEIGADTLRDLQGMGFELAACSNFISKLLEREIR